MIDWIVDKPGMRLGLGDSVDYEGDADLVFSHLYGPLPRQLRGKPAIVNVYGGREDSVRRWTDAAWLTKIGTWGLGGTNTIYAANIHDARCVEPASIRDLIEEEFAPRRGWFPPELVRTLLVSLAPWNIVRMEKRAITVFDGFMGRGTVGKVALDLGMNFVGIDRDPARLKIAREYLGC